MIRVAFRYNDPRLFARLVRLLQGGDSAHCEASYAWDGRFHCCVSASFLDGGVRATGIDLDPAKWRVYELDMTSDRVLIWFSQHVGQGYDWLGLLGFVIRRVKGWSRRQFCSEAVAGILGLPDAYRYDLALLESVCSRFGRRVDV